MPSMDPYIQEELRNTNDAHNRIVQSLIVNRQQQDAFAYASQLLSNQQELQYSSQTSMLNRQFEASTGLAPSDLMRNQSHSSISPHGLAFAQEGSAARINPFHGNVALQDTFDSRIIPRSISGQTNAGINFAGIGRQQDWTEEAETTREKSFSRKKTAPTVPTLQAKSGDEQVADSGGKAASTESFPEKLHRILQDAEKSGNDDIISFYPDGRSFGIHDNTRFVAEIMPHYFNTSRYASFQRQLNLYGFNKCFVGKDNRGYFHEFFVKGQPKLCKRIKRKKQKVPMGDTYHPFLDDPAILATSMNTPTMQMQAAALQQHESIMQGPINQMQTGAAYPNIMTGFSQPMTGFNQPMTGFNQPLTGFNQPASLRGQDQGDANANITSALMERQRRSMLLASLQQSNQTTDQSNQQAGGNIHRHLF